MEMSALQISLWILGIAVSVWIVYTAYKITDVYSGAQALIEATKLAHDLVATAEQYYKTGRIQKDDRYRFVFLQLSAAFPSLTEDRLNFLIESAVVSINALVGAVRHEVVRVEIPDDLEDIVLRGFSEVV